jgi:hypothetical protein
MELGYSEQIVWIIEIKAGQPMKGDIFVQVRIRWAGHYMDHVSEILQSTADSFDIDALTTACGIATVGEETDPERIIV